MLTDIELNAIRQEAEKYSKDMEGVSHDTRHGIFVGHIAAATKERERANGLLEALELIKRHHQYTVGSYEYRVADNSIANYNESLKG